MDKLDGRSVDVDVATDEQTNNKENKRNGKRTEYQNEPPMDKI